MLAPATAFLAAFTFAGYLSPIVAVVIAMLLIVIGMAFLRVKTDPLPEPTVQEGMRGEESEADVAPGELQVDEEVESPRRGPPPPGPRSKGIRKK